MAIFLAASLSGSAQAVLSDLDEPSRKDYYALKGALALRFGNGGQKELFRSELKNRMRQKGETLPELSQAIQRLVRQAYPDAPQSVREVMERDHFLDAIPDTDIRWKVLQARPKTVRDALSIATEVEAFQASERQRHRTGGLTANVVETQIPGKQVPALEMSINKIWDEMKKDREEQRRLLEGFVRKMADTGGSLTCGARDRLAEEIVGTVDSLVIFLETALIHLNVTTRETEAGRAKGPKFGPPSVSEAHTHTEN